MWALADLWGVVQYYKAILPSPTRCSLLDALSAIISRIVFPPFEMAPSAVDIEAAQAFHNDVQGNPPSGHLKGTMLKFDPALHLNFVPPTKRHSFTELGLDAEAPPVDMCITEPFSLFTEEAVRLIRHELFQPQVFDNYMHSWARAPCVIRGIAPTV